MNRTIDLWNRVAWKAPVSSASENTIFLMQAIQDMQELARQRDELAYALEAMLEIHGVTQKYADTHIDIPQSWVDVSDIARAALQSIKEQTK